MKCLRRHKKEWVVPLLYGRFIPGIGAVPIVQEAGWTSGPVWAAQKMSPPPKFDSRILQPIAHRSADYSKYWVQRDITKTWWDKYAYLFLKLFITILIFFWPKWVYQQDPHNKSSVTNHYEYYISLHFWLQALPLTAYLNQLKCHDVSFRSPCSNNYVAGTALHSKSLWGFVPATNYGNSPF